MTNVPKGWHIDSRTWKELMMGDRITFITLTAGPCYYFMCCRWPAFWICHGNGFWFVNFWCNFLSFFVHSSTIETDRRVFFSSLLWNPTTNVHQCCESRRGLLSFLHEPGLESATIHTMNLLHIFTRMMPRLKILECEQETHRFCCLKSNCQTSIIISSHLTPIIEWI